MKKKVNIVDNLEKIAEKIHLSLSAKDGVREKALRQSRDIIRHCANAIRAIHRKEQEKAREQLASANQMLSELFSIISGEHTDLLSAGYIQDAQKEFAEASISFAIVNMDPIPGPDELNVNYASYLNGMGESIGELRRYILDSLRLNDFSRCEEILSLMDEMYSILVTMDFPDAMVHGLRRTTDAARGILEKTRGDLTIALKQNEYISKFEPPDNKR